MRNRRPLATLLLAPFAAGCAFAQAKPTASRGIEPTVFVMGTAQATGVAGNNVATLPGGKNISVIAGLNVDFYAVGPFRLGLEARGMYPIISGKIVDERELVGGVRMSYDTTSAHVLRPYLDAQFGRGQMNYPSGYKVGNLLYQQTASNIYGGGGGLEYDFLDQFSLKLDGQAHHWTTPVVTGNSVWAGQVSIGVAYRLFANTGPR